MAKKEIQQVANFIYESGILSKTPRSGLWFLGTGKQSVAEHSLRAAFIGFALGSLVPKADKAKVLLMRLLHDLGEGRTSDLNYVHQKYGKLAEAQAIDDISRNIPFGKAVKELYGEFEARETLEAKLARDADQLEWIATLREEAVKGNTKAAVWLKSALKRLKNPTAQKIGKMLLTTHPDKWWFSEKDQWFVDRKAQHRKWK